MTDPSDEPALTKASPDPAADAAAMLLRLGFSIFALVVPSTSLLSRWVIVVLVPISAMLIILSGLLRRDPLRALRSAYRRLLSLPGLLVLLLVCWAGFSLAWTPQPGVAASKLLKIGGIALITFLAIESLPQRMRASNLHLVSIGVAVAAVMILSALLGDLTGLWYLKLAALVPERSALLLACMSACAAAWLLIKDRPRLAVVLGGMVALIVVLDPGGEVRLPALVGAFIFLLAWGAPEFAGCLLGQIGAGVVVLGPLLAGLAEFAGFARLGGWWEVVVLDPLRAITGRGFDAATALREKGVLSETLPHSLLSNLWFDLGLLGALGFSMLVYFGFRALGRLGLEVAPLALAGVSVGLIYAGLERSATQTWWLNAMAVFVIVLAAVERGRYRTLRPRAALTVVPAP